MSIENVVHTQFSQLTLLPLRILLKRTVFKDMKLATGFSKSVN
jgi:hypothetical protein